MPADQPTPSIGRIVIYRSRDGVDMAAIVTGFPDTPSETDVHLHLFPPPGHGGDVLSHEWGVEMATAPESRGTWRWPERVT